VLSQCQTLQKAELLEMDTCIRCGWAFRAQSRFCGQCGDPRRDDKPDGNWRWWGLVLLSIVGMGVWVLANDPNIIEALRKAGIEPRAETKSPSGKAFPKAEATPDGTPDTADYWVKTAAGEPSAEPATADADPPNFKLEDIPGTSATYYITQQQPDPGSYDTYAPERHMADPGSPQKIRISYLDLQPITVTRYVINGRVGKLPCDSSAVEPPNKLTPEEKKDMAFLRLMMALAGQGSLPRLPVHMETGDAITIPVPAIASCGATIVRMDLYTDRGDVLFDNKDK
jgi:hypothetical protein